MKKVAIQGYKGCFHEEAANDYFADEVIDTIPCDSFDQLANLVQNSDRNTIGIMAIENSIAGSLLQNYRILRQYDLYITGEKYLRIVHNLMALPNTNISDIKEVWSHPMALNQCLSYLQQHDHYKLVEKDDTALCAKDIHEENLQNVAAIASKSAAEIYDLDILAPAIETSKVNYTRFFIVEKRNGNHGKEKKFNKASVYIRIGHTRGSLLGVLQSIHDHNLNLSKLQSFPVLGALGEYFFHLDLEINDETDYYNLLKTLTNLTYEVQELGRYMRDIRPVLAQNKIS